MMYKPLVSIIIPVYKGYPFLSDAIISCLNQTYSQIEVIIVNDGSPDNGETASIAKRFGDKVRYYEKNNGGVSSALNFGISKMRGEWFSWLSHDDLYFPDKIEKQIEAVSKYDDKICVIRCTTSSINESGNAIFRPQRKINGCFSATKMMHLHSLKEVGLYGCTLLIHRNILEKCGPFDETLKTVQDEDYWNRIMFNGYSFISIPEVLVQIRIHQGQTTNLLADRFASEREMMIRNSVSYYKKNTDENFPLLYILAKKQALEHRIKPLNILLDELKSNPRFNNSMKMLLYCYFTYGYLYSFVKRIYRMIIIRHNRG